MTARPGPRQSRPRSEARYGPERGTTYLLHFERPYKHAEHYRGWTRRPIAERLAEHLRGDGSVLTRAVVQAGIGLVLARTWPNTTKDREDSLKHQGGARRCCPQCGIKPAASRLASDRMPDPAPERLSLYELERSGTTSDGVPLPHFTTYPDRDAAAETARREENDMFGRKTAHAVTDRMASAWPAGPAPRGLQGYLRDDTVEALEECDRVREREGTDILRRWSDPGGEPDHLYGAPECTEADPEGGRVAARWTSYPELGAEAAADAPVLDPRPDGTYADAIVGMGAVFPGAGDAATADGSEPGTDAMHWAPPLSAEEAQQAAYEAATRKYGPYVATLARDIGWTPDRVARNVAARADLAEHGRGTADMAEPWPGESHEDLLDVARGQAEPDATPAESFGLELEERAELAETMRRLETRALAREHIAQAAHDDAAAVLARRTAAGMRQTRLDAVAETYDAAAIMQAAALESDEPATDMPYVTREDQAAAAYETPANLQGEALDEADAPDHLYGAPECTEADPEGDHFGHSPGDPQDSGRSPLPRVLEPDEVNPALAPVAATLPDGTRHADPFLSDRGWQASDGLYVRQRSAQMEAGA